jgi:plastocyanin
MSNEEQHKNVIAGKDNSIKIKGGLEVEGDLTIKGESAGVGGGGSFSEEEMRRLLSAGNVTVPAVEWVAGVEPRDIKEGHIIIEHDLAQLLVADKMNYRSIVLGARIKYDVTPNDSTSYTFSQNGVDTSVDNNTLNIDLLGFRTGEVVTFVNTSSSHPLEIVDANDVVVATQSGKTTTWSPTATGAYKYRCQTHPGVMTGNMTVLEGEDTLYEIVGSTRSAANNPGSLNKDAHPEVFTLRYLVAPDGSDSAESENAAVDCRVTAIGLLGEYAVKNFQMSVKNLLADDAPSWADAPGSLVLDVSERSSSGAEDAWTLGRLMAKRRAADTDADGNVVDSPATFTHPDRYLIHDNGSGDKDSFELVSGTFAGVASPLVLNGGNTGQTLTDILQFKAGFEPDFETKSQYTITIRAYNDYTIGAGDTGKYSDLTFTINITDSAWDNAPLWQTAPIEINVAEGNDTRSANSGAANNNSINGPLNLRKYLQTVTLSGDSASDTSPTGNVINDPPGNTANPNAQQYTFSIIDSDISGGTLLGSSSAGSNAASTWFSIANGGSGQTGSPWLTFHSDKVDSDGIDWESTGLAWGGNAGTMHHDVTNSFYLTVRANNPLEGKTADKIVRVIVNNDHTDDAPEWTGTGGTTSGSPIHTPENQTLEFINLPNQINEGMSATEILADGQRNTTTFTIDGSLHDGAKFTINGDYLKFIDAPDFENPTDVSTAGLAGNDNLYAVKIIATNSKGVGKDDSGGRTTEKVLFIQVDDSTADNTAQFPGGLDLTHTIDEWVVEGTGASAIYTIPAGVATDHYEIHTNPTIGSNATPFWLDGNTIKTQGDIDLSIEATTNFNLTIEAVNAVGSTSGREARTFTIIVQNVLTDEFDMDNPFEFTIEP